MTPELGEILGKKAEGKKFRFSEDPQTEFEVLSVDVEKVDGEDMLIGYNLQERGPRVRHAYYGKVFIGAGTEYQEGSVEIIEQSKSLTK